MPCFAAGTFRSRSALLIALALSILTVPAMGQTGEVGAPSAGPTTEIEIPPLTFDVSVSYGYDLLTETDMSDTYQGLPNYGLELSIGFDENAALLFGVRHGSTEGDPFYNDPTFQSGVKNKLEVTPLSVGLKVNASEHPRLPIWLGGSFLAVWCRETTPGQDDGLASQAQDGWGMGFRASVQPQWRSASDEYGVGLEISFGGADIDLNSSWYGHTASTAGVAAHLVFSKRL